MVEQDDSQEGYESMKPRIKFHGDRVLCVLEAG